MAKRFVVLLLLGFFYVFYFSGDGFTQETKRPFYEHPGNYRDEINLLKAEFVNRFGYELIDLEHEWKPWEIKKLSIAFSNLPETFLKIKGVKGFYLLSKFRGGPEGMSVDDIPAATFPSFQTVYRNASMVYQVEVGNQEPRIEFYTKLFYEDQEDINNIVQHEMAHIYDMFENYLSFSDEWLKITDFELIHLPALDSRPGDDYLFTPLNNFAKLHYAPVSTLQLPTYSRQNAQEDFANSVAAYINYPYFQFSHPKRYQFLKEKVFGGKHYFLEEDIEYVAKVTLDFQKAIENKNWERVIKITREMARDYHPEIEKKLVRLMENEIKNAPDSVRDLKLALASCNLMDPNSLKIRKNLIRKKRVPLKVLLKQRSCALMAKRSFEKELGLWSMRNIYFFRSKGEAYIQFMDPVSLTSRARGFDTRYNWRVFNEGSSVHLAEGSFAVNGINLGSVKINLEETAVGTLNLPLEKPLILELGAQRVHPLEFKRLNTKISKIRFVIPAGFNYNGFKKTKIKIVYPLRPEFQRLN
ncbi:MAG: hypothetical protein VX495_06230 [Nitrospinota bacterium]|nr:hypothetical protein [Nitrospinota bacterium]